jgi:hypothetical protein
VTTGTPVRVRPRLPGPFERADGHWSDSEVTDAPTSLSSPARPPSTLGVSPVSAMVRREHRVVRTETTRGRDTVASGSSRLLAPAGLVRPDLARQGVHGLPAVAAVTGEPRPDSGALRRVRPSPAGPTAGPGSPTSSTAQLVRDRSPGRAGSAPPAERSVPVPAALRVAEASRPGGSQPRETLVHVRIGRLEVRAAGALRPGPEPARSSRRARAVPLAEYLSGREAGALP